MCPPKLALRAASAEPDEHSALLELMSPKVLSLEELISLASDGSQVLDRLPRAAVVSRASYLESLTARCGGGCSSGIDECGRPRGPTASCRACAQCRLDSVGRLRAGSICL
jgi:hypothetical protein